MSKKNKTKMIGAGSANEDSTLDFPIGRVANTIRKTISPSLSNHDVECITVVLVSHLMIEQKINALIFVWLTKHLPKMSSKNKQNMPVNDVAEDELLKYVNKLDFVKKLELIKPLGTLLWNDDSKDIFKDIHKINNARVEVAHRLDIKGIKFDSKSLATEAGLERFLNLAQQRLLNISDLIELVNV